MKVLAISYGRHLFEVGNAERNRMERCAAAVAEYHMIIFSLQSHGLEKQQVGNLHLHPTNSRSRLWMLFDAYQIGQALLQENKNWVITTQDPFEAGVVGYALARKRAVPFNVQEHGDFYTTNHWARDRFSNRIRKWFGLRILWRADSVRVVSDRMRQTFERLGIAPQKIKYLPVRTDQAVAAEYSNSPTVIRAEKPDASVIILTMARLVTQKNLPLLIAAFAHVLQQDSQALLVIVGEGSEEDNLKRQVAQLKLTENVLFLPWSDTPQALLKEADIYALSSNWEGWGRVLIEAMAAGVPIVTTDVGCAGEVVKNDVHGFVVPLDDVEQFATQLGILVTDAALRQQFGEAAKREVANWHMGIDDYAHAWANVLTETQIAGV